MDDKYVGETERLIISLDLCNSTLLDMKHEVVQFFSDIAKCKDYHEVSALLCETNHFGNEVGIFSYRIKLDKKDDILTIKGDGTCALRAAAAIKAHNNSKPYTDEAYAVDENNNITSFTASMLEMANAARSQLPMSKLNEFAFEDIMIETNRTLEVLCTALSTIPYSNINLNDCIDDSVIRLLDECTCTDHHIGRYQLYQEDFIYYEDRGIYDLDLLTKRVFRPPPLQNCSDCNSIEAILACEANIIVKADPITRKSNHYDVCIKTSQQCQELQYHLSTCINYIAEQVFINKDKIYSTLCKIHNGLSLSPGSSIATTISNVESDSDSDSDSDEDFDDNNDTVTIQQQLSKVHCNIEIEGEIALSTINMHSVVGPTASAEEFFEKEDINDMTSQLTRGIAYYLNTTIQASTNIALCANEFVRKAHCIPTEDVFSLPRFLDDIGKRYSEHVLNKLRKQFSGNERATVKDALIAIGSMPLSDFVANNAFNNGSNLEESDLDEPPIVETVVKTGHRSAGRKFGAINLVVKNVHQNFQRTVRSKLREIAKILFCSFFDIYIGPAINSVSYQLDLYPSITDVIRAICSANNHMYAAESMISLLHALSSGSATCYLASPKPKVSSEEDMINNVANWISSGLCERIGIRSVPKRSSRSMKSVEGMQAPEQSSSKKRKVSYVS